METYTIQDALKEEKGKIVLRLKVKLLSVYPRENKEGQYGAYTKQNGVVQDDTGKMKIAIMDYRDLTNCVGSTLILKSIQNKNKISGVAVDRYEWKGKEEIVLKVSGKTGLIVPEDEEDSVSVVKDSPRPTTGSNSVVPEVNHEDRKLGIATAKNRLTQLAGLYDLCYETALKTSYFGKNNNCSVNMDNFINNIKDITTTLFIQSVREGLADKMPVRTLSKFYNEEALKVNDTKNAGSPVDDSPENDDIPF